MINEEKKAIFVVILELKIKQNKEKIKQDKNKQNFWIVGIETRRKRKYPHYKGKIIIFNLDILFLLLIILFPFLIGEATEMTK